MKLDHSFIGVANKSHVTGTFSLPKLSICKIIFKEQPMTLCNQLWYFRFCFFACETYIGMNASKHIHWLCQNISFLFGFAVLCVWFVRLQYVIFFFFLGSSLSRKYAIMNEKSTSVCMVWNMMNFMHATRRIQLSNLASVTFGILRSLYSPFSILNSEYYYIYILIYFGFFNIFLLFVKLNQYGIGRYS